MSGKKNFLVNQNCQKFRHTWLQDWKLKSWLSAYCLYVLFCLLGSTSSKAALEQISRAWLYFCRALAVCRWISAFCLFLFLSELFKNSILNWGRASHATIQPLVKLQNKAIRIINPTNMGSLEEDFQHLNILCLPKLYSFSVGKFMHSYHNKLLPNHFDEYFVPLSSIHCHSTRLATSKNLFLPRVNSSSGKCSLKFIGPKEWSSIPDDIKFSTTFTFKWKLKKHLLFEKKIPNYEL